MTTATPDPLPKCSYCGIIHGPTCWMVKAIEYHQDGSIKRVEFKNASDYPTQQIVSIPTVFGSLADVERGYQQPSSLPKETKP